MGGGWSVWPKTIANSMILPHVSFSARLRRLRVLIHYSTPACNVKEQITFHFEVTLRKILTEPTPLALTRRKHSSLPLA